MSNWQIIKETNPPYMCRTERLKVPGGWLVRSFYSSGYAVGLHHIFIGEKTNEYWLVETEKKEQA